MRIKIFRYINGKFIFFYERGIEIFRNLRTNEPLAKIELPMFPDNSISGFLWRFLHDKPENKDMHMANLQKLLNT